MSRECQGFVKPENALDTIPSICYFYDREDRPMKDKNHSTIQVIEKKDARIIHELAGRVEKVVGHKTLEEIIRLTEEEEGID
jgi:hypothetical protein